MYTTVVCLKIPKLIIAGGGVAIFARNPRIYNDRRKKIVKTNWQKYNIWILDTVTMKSIQ